MSQSQKPQSPQGGNDTARAGRTRPAAEFARGATATGFARAGFPDASLVLRWSEIVGPEVARLAEPVRLQMAAEGGVLTLKCETGAAVFLQHQTRSIIERLNAYLGPGRIVRLKFIPGKLSPPAGPPSHPLASSSAYDSTAPKELSAALQRFAILRQTIRR